MSHYVGSVLDFPFFHCSEEVKFEKFRSTLLARYSGQPSSELGPSLIVLRHPYSHLYLAEHFDF